MLRSLDWTVLLFIIPPEVSYCVGEGIRAFWVPWILGDLEAAYLNLDLKKVSLRVEVA